MLLETAETRASMIFTHQLYEFTSQFKWCLLKLQAWGVSQHKTEVDMNQMSLSVYQNVFIVPILDL